MKNRNKALPAPVAVAFFCGALAVVEVFHLHPQLNIGNFHAYWSGLGQMRFEAGTMTIPPTSGRQEIQKDYHVGPMKVAIVSGS